MFKVLDKNVMVLEVASYESGISSTVDVTETDGLGSLVSAYFL